MYAFFSFIPRPILRLFDTAHQINIGMGVVKLVHWLRPNHTGVPMVQYIPEVL